MFLFQRLAILGLTQQYISSSITRDQYDRYYLMCSDEVARLNPPVANTPSALSGDETVRPSDEFRFPLLRHWNLFDAMAHSSYVANKLGTWREDGRKRMTRMLTKMG
jgi:cell division control protein 45